MISRGISPAYFISRFSGNFGPEEIGSSLPDIASLGYDTVQLELFRSEDFERWTKRRIGELRQQLIAQGLRVSQGVAHFLGDGFTSPEALERNDEEQFKRTLEIFDAFEECRICTLPQPPFRYTPSSAHSGAASYREMRLRLEDKLHRFLRISESMGHSLALEILPYSFVGGSEGFLSLYTSLSQPDLGYNLDTGHALSCKENLSLLPLKLGTLVYGTHLSDNHAGESLSLKPGDGIVEWTELLRSLDASGYEGSLDIEIKCSPERVEEEYREGLAALDAFTAQTFGG
jgi:sugar phosphate isomerase/epimerase